LGRFGRFCFGRFGRLFWAFLFFCFFKRIGLKFRNKSRANRFARRENLTRVSVPPLPRGHLCSTRITSSCASTHDRTLLRPRAEMRHDLVADARRHPCHRGWNPTSAAAGAGCHAASRQAGALSEISSNGDRVRGAIRRRCGGGPLGGAGQFQFPAGSG